MNHQGSCHCGRVAFEAEGEIGQLADCNCSICQRTGAIHWFVPRDKLRLKTPAADLATYTFGSGSIKHHFCPVCGIHPFGEGADPAGNAMAAVNVRCLDGVDLAVLTVKHFDGRSL